MDFRNTLKSRRSELGLTLDDIGRRVGVSGATVSRWENGDIENMRRDKIAKLAEVLGVTPAHLMGWPESDLFGTSECGKRLKVLARHLEKIPEETRNRLVKNFEDTIDTYLDAMGIPREDED